MLGQYIHRQEGSQKEERKLLNVPVTHISFGGKAIWGGFYGFVADLGGDTQAGQASEFNCRPRPTQVEPAVAGRHSSIEAAIGCLHESCRWRVEGRELWRSFELLAP